MIEEQRSGQILLLRLNRPEALNAIDPGMAKALEAVAERVRADDSIAAVVLTGSGRAFCAGGDVAAFRKSLTDDGAPPLPELLDELASRVHRALQRLVEAGPLLIGAINGSATGAGMGLVLACDLAFARPGADLRAGFSRLGLSPDTSTTYFLPRVVGYRQALQILLCADAIDVNSAHSLGIYQDIIALEPAEFLDEVLKRTESLLKCGAAAVRTRALLRSSPSNTLAEQLQHEQMELLALAKRADVQAQLLNLLQAR